MADAPDLGSGASRREGSSPSTRTKRDCRMKLCAIAYSPFLFHVWNLIHDRGRACWRKSTARSCWTVFLCQLRPANCQLRPKAFILHYACVKIHNIPNCYWQDPFKYDILRVTHKAGSFKAPGWYRKRADTGADRPCFCVFNRIATQFST